MSGRNTCMGIYPFKDPHKKIFQEIVYPLVETHTGLTCLDGLSHYEAVTIKMDLIGRQIDEAKLILVDISEKNENVFLELGIAHILKKPIILLCSKKAYEEVREKNMPFDIRGKELLIFEDNDDLKIQLGKYISDCLFKTQFKSVSWISTYEKSHIRSASELEFFEKPTELSETPKFWSSIPIHNNFIIRYDVKIKTLTDVKNPDLRLFISPNQGEYPRIGIILPWENSEMNKEKYECHVTYYQTNEKNEPGKRIRQRPVVIKNGVSNLEFQVFVSFYYPNLVVESTLFSEIDRIVVSLNQFNTLNYPTHFDQYIGFESPNNVLISNISIKEVYL